METIGLGGGCHWCTEGVFQALRGVARVEQGFLRSDPPWDAWAEGVIAHYDPAVIDLATLVEVHLRTHSAQHGYSPGGRYRSAVYTSDREHQAVATQAIAAFAASTQAPLRTMVLALAGFRPSEGRYQNYYRTDPDRPFCRRYIDPKLDLIRRDFATHALPVKAGGIAPDA